MKKYLLSIIFVCIAAGAEAADYAAFTRDLVRPYEYFKQSLALTSKKEDADKAKAALSSFVEAWGPFAARYAADVPQPFAGIADFAAKIRRPLEIGTLAAGQLNSGDVARAHGTLEEIRYLLWDLRTKAGIVSLADKANDFHEALEIILGQAAAAKTADEAKRVSARYGAWFLIKWDDMANAADLAAVRKAFDPAFSEGRTVVVSYLAALTQGDSAKAGKLSASVKGAYKKIWMLDNQ